MWPSDFLWRLQWRFARPSSSCAGIFKNTWVPHLMHASAKSPWWCSCAFICVARRSPQMIFSIHYSRVSGFLYVVVGSQAKSFPFWLFNSGRAWPSDGLPSNRGTTAELTQTFWCLLSDQGQTQTTPGLQGGLPVTTCSVLVSFRPTYSLCYFLRVRLGPCIVAHALPSGLELVAQPMAERAPVTSQCR